MLKEGTLYTKPGLTPLRRMQTPASTSVLSYHILPSKHPPTISDNCIAWCSSRVHMYMYNQMAPPCKSPPMILTSEFQASMGAYLVQYGTNDIT